jgi:hypothetical protein
LAKQGFVLNRNAVAELMKSEAMQEILAKRADEIRGRAGTGYGQDTYVGKNRANAMVFADTYDAKRDNLKNNTLLKAVR